MKNKYIDNTIGILSAHAIWKEEMIQRPRKNVWDYYKFSSDREGY